MAKKKEKRNVADEILARLLECLTELTAAAEENDCASRELLEQCRAAIAQAAKLRKDRDGDD